jgi:predicted RNase H-like HicB family nuclease
VTEYALYVESGPKHRKTMVHVLDLLGCIANGPTTDEAIEATPEAIRTYLKFLKRHGEDVYDSDGAFTTRVAEHVTEGMWLGNGSPYLLFGPDVEPVTEAEIETFTRRFEGLREQFATWADTQTDTQLDAIPKDDGRPARAMLLHVMSTPGAYLSAALGGSKGYNRLQTMAERGEISLADGLRQVKSIAIDALRATTSVQRRAIVRRPKDVRTLRKAIRRMLEHDWEHLRELSRRPGGPRL